MVQALGITVKYGFRCSCGCLCKDLVKAAMISAMSPFHERQGLTSRRDLGFRGLEFRDLEFRV